MLTSEPRLIQCLSIRGGLDVHIGPPYGPTARQAGIGPQALPARLGPATFELLVIAGRRRLNPLYFWLLPGPDDGKATVDVLLVT